MGVDPSLETGDSGEKRVWTVQLVLWQTITATTYREGALRGSRRGYDGEVVRTSVRTHAIDRDHPLSIRHQNPLICRPIA